MNDIQLKELVKSIVEKATILKDKHTDSKNTHVNYACVFSQTKEEYEDLVKAAGKIGKVIKETQTGLLFHINTLETVSGKLKLLKIRISDPTRPERGDADFTIPDFPEFEKKYIQKKGFSIMHKDTFYMIELADPEFDVRAYFSNPPLDKQLNIK